MKKIKLLIVIIFFSSSSYSQDCDDLRNGVFALFKNGKRIGTIYRKKNYQIETYFNDNKTTIAKTKFINCTLVLNNYEVKKDIDTITWLIKYRKQNNYYSFEGKPKYLNINFSYKGKLKKLKSFIVSKKILNIIKVLDSCSTSIRIK